MESDEESKEEYENEKNLNNDMSDLKEDDVDSDKEGSIKITKEEIEKNKSKKLFTQKLKNKKVIMDEARKELPYTFKGKCNN